MKKLAVQLIKELSSLTDAIPAGFKGLFAKSSGLFWKNSDGTEKQIATSDQIPTTLPANGGNSDTVDGYHATSLVKYADPIMPTNPFGGKRLYINSVDNAMYAADKKWWVVATTHLQSYGGNTYPLLNPAYVSIYSTTGSGTIFNVVTSPADIVVYNNDTICTAVTTPTTQYQYTYVGGVLTFGATVTGTLYVYPGPTITQYLDSPVASTIANIACFNGSYEDGVDIPVGYYAKIRIMFNDTGTASYNGGYPYGNFYLSYYYTYTPDSAYIRTFNRNYRPHTPGWHINTFSNYIGTNATASFIQSCTPDAPFGRTIMEFIIIGHGSHATKLTEIDWQLDRPNLSETGSTVTKFGVNKLYFALEFWQQLTKRIGLNPDGSATFDKTVQSNEIINFDANIEPTQTGASVTKTSTWMWQYLAQGIKWLRANFSNYSLTTHNHNLASLAEKNYSSLSNIPTTFTPSAHNHALASLSEKSYNSLTDKPTIPAAQVQTDWNATTGLGVLLNKPASLPANGGNSTTVGGLPASAFAKSDTAFTSYNNILGNNADCAVFVIDTSSRWISNAIHEILANNITLPSGTSSMVLILQPGIYEIVHAIDFDALNIKAIIGLCKDSTIINVANPDLILNLELIENLTINIQGNSGNIIFGGSALQKNEAHNLKIKYVGSLGYDIEIMCFASYSCINNCIVEGITGVAYKSNNISNITHICENINNYTSVAALQRAVNVSNFTGRYSLPIEVGKDCRNLENFSIELLVADSLLIGCFNDCSMLSNINILNCDIGFNSCEVISNSIVKTDTSNTATVAYSNCNLLSNCKAVAYVGFGGCNRIVSSEALSCNIGFYSSAKISVSRASGCTLYGFDSCSGLIQNSSDNYNSCFADSNASYAISDTPGGGFNS